MADNSKIEWCNASWSPIRAWLKPTMIDVPPQRWGYHCERVSPGCKNCYASTMNGRMLPAWGTGLDYTVPNREKVEIFLDEKELLKPLSWKKPRRIFVESMSDWCATFVSDEMRDRIMAVAALCPQHTFLFLTKRADGCVNYFGGMALCRIVFAAEQIIGDYALRDSPWPLPNVYLGFSAENQECFDERWGHMRGLAATGWKVWCSAEPLLEPINMEHVLNPNPYQRIPGGYVGDRPDLMARPCQIVVGGESGHGARPMNIAWVRSIIAQCKAAGTAVFCKQLGAKPYIIDGGQSGDHNYFLFTASRELVPAYFKGHVTYMCPNDRKGGDMSEWPEDLRVREFPHAT